MLQSRALVAPVAHPAWLIRHAVLATTNHCAATRAFAAAGGRVRILPPSAFPIHAGALPLNQAKRLQALSRPGLMPGRPPIMDEVQYQGHFHDAVVQHVARAVRNSGGAAVTEIRLKPIGTGRTARVDLIVRTLRVPPTPFLVEVKTGQGWRFTGPQWEVYPLVMIGWHVMALEQRVTQVGLTPNEWLPPLEVHLHVAERPGYTIQPFVLTLETFSTRTLPWAPPP